MVSLDFRDMYLHVPIHRECRYFLCLFSKAATTYGGCSHLEYFQLFTCITNPTIYPILHIWGTVFKIYIDACIRANSDPDVLMHHLQFTQDVHSSGPVCWRCSTSCCWQSAAPSTSMAAGPRPSDTAQALIMRGQCFLTLHIHNDECQVLISLLIHLHHIFSGGSQHWVFVLGSLCIYKLVQLSERRSSTTKSGMRWKPSVMLLTTSSVQQIPGDYLNHLRSTWKLKGSTLAKYLAVCRCKYNWITDIYSCCASVPYFRSYTWFWKSSWRLYNWADSRCMYTLRFPYYVLCIYWINPGTLDTVFIIINLSCPFLSTQLEVA